MVGQRIDVILAVVDHNVSQLELGDGHLSLVDVTVGPGVLKLPVTSVWTGQLSVDIVLRGDDLHACTSSSTVV